MIKTKKNGQKVRVTFTFLPEDGVKSVLLSGEWNDWVEEPMKQKKNGEFYKTKTLAAGNTFQFGYKIDSEWVTDSECPSVASPFQTQNSVLEL